MDSLWPILILWVVVALFGAAKKKKPPPRAGVPGQIEADLGEAAPARGGGLLGELGKALEELKRAEAQARQRQQAPTPAAPAAPVPPRTSGAARAYLEQRKQAAQGRKQPERKVFVPAPKPARPSRVTRPAMPLADDDADKSSEAEAAVVLDYDSEAESVAGARLRGADRGARREVSSEGLSAAQAARRAPGREGTPIGGAAEHAEWHERQADAYAGKPSAAAPRRGALARFATGSLRGAIVLSEVLGRPVGER